MPALVVDLYDGSRTINLVWLGRRTIGGIEPGTYLRASGRVTYTRGIPTIFNPSYEIVAAAWPTEPTPLGGPDRRGAHPAPAVDRAGRLARLGGDRPAHGGLRRRSGSGART